MAEPESLVRIGSTEGGRGFFIVSHPEYRELAERIEGLEALVAYQVSSAILNVEAELIGLAGGLGAARFAARVLRNLSGPRSRRRWPSDPLSLG